MTRYQFSLRSLLLAVLVFSVVVGAAASAVRWHRESEALLLTHVALLAFAGLYQGWQDPLAPSRRLTGRQRMKTGILATAWVTAIPLIWAAARTRLFDGPFAEFVYFLCAIAAFFNVVMSWFGLFHGLALVYRGRRGFGLLLVAICLVPLTTAIVLFGLIGIR